MSSKAKRITLTAAAVVAVLGGAAFALRVQIRGLLGVGPQKYTGPISLGAGEALIVLDVPRMT